MSNVVYAELELPLLEEVPEDKTAETLYNIIELEISPNNENEFKI